MKIKKFFALMCIATAMMLNFALPSMAVESKETVIDLGDGFYMVETIVQGPMTRAGDTVSGSKSARIYQGSTLIGVTTLSATFDISGSTAKATKATISGEGSGGWSYKTGTTQCSGNKATGTATYQSGSTTKSHSLTITCSPDGTLS